MPLEKQVCSLEHAKELEELGVKQESLWWWHCLQGKWGASLRSDVVKDAGSKVFSAFTTAELLEILPTHVRTRALSIRKYGVSYKVNASRIMTTGDRNSADAISKMLVYLLKNKLFTL